MVASGEWAACSLHEPEITQDTGTIMDNEALKATSISGVTAEEEGCPDVGLGWVIVLTPRTLTTATIPTRVSPSGLAWTRTPMMVSLAATNGVVLVAAAIWATYLEDVNIMAIASVTKVDGILSMKDVEVFQECQVGIHKTIIALEGVDRAMAAIGVILGIVKVVVVGRVHFCAL